MVDQRLNYLHENPVRAGIVLEAAHYKYSSAIDYYEERKGSCQFSFSCDNKAGRSPVFMKIISVPLRNTETRKGQYGFCLKSKIPLLSHACRVCIILKGAIHETSL